MCSNLILYSFVQSLYKLVLSESVVAPVVPEMISSHKKFKGGRKLLSVFWNKIKHLSDTNKKRFFLLSLVWFLCWACWESSIDGRIKKNLLRLKKTYSSNVFWIQIMSGELFMIFYSFSYAHSVIHVRFESWWSKAVLFYPILNDNANMFDLLCMLLPASLYLPMWFY